MTPGAQGATPDDEVVGLLSDLIRADTSNPPGDAAPAARVLERYFRDNGIEPTLVGESPELTNCIARVHGEGEGPSLLLLGHLDVVPADAEEWSRPPFSGLVEGGYVWGRGALDMKNQLATQAVALVRMARRKRAGEVMRGDLIFAASADEETGEHCGAKWLLDTRPESLRADFVLNEGGMDMFVTADAHVYTIHIGEKGYAACRITISGRSSHGSVPLHRENAVVGLARVISALEQYEPEVSLHRIPGDVIDKVVPDRRSVELLKDPATAHAAVRGLALTDPGAAALIEPLLGLTFSSTIVRAGGQAVNVIPSRASVTVDCRLLPGQTAEDIRREITQALSGIEDPWEMEVLNFMPGSESPSDTLFHEAIAATMRDLVPDSEVLCAHFSGFTDSAHVRAAFPDAVAYGFCPFIVDGVAAVRSRLHGVDERIAVADLVLQTRFCEELAARLLA